MRRKIIYFNGGFSTSMCSDGPTNSCKWTSNSFNSGLVYQFKSIIKKKNSSLSAVFFFTWIHLHFFVGHFSSSNDFRRGEVPTGEKLWGELDWALGEVNGAVAREQFLGIHWEFFVTQMRAPWCWNIYLVGGLEHFVFSHILGIIIPAD